MRKVDNGEKKWVENTNGKIMTEIVATNVVASQPPERQPTAMPIARANYHTYFSWLILKHHI